MVARCSAKTSAILTRYTSLRSFQEWRYERLAETKEKLWSEKGLILNYAPVRTIFMTYILRKIGSSFA
jgi:hypothetical protein